MTPEMREAVLRRVVPAESLDGVNVDRGGSVAAVHADVARGSSSSLDKFDSLAESGVKRKRRPGGQSGWLPGGVGPARRE